MTTLPFLAFASAVAASLMAAQPAVPQLHVSMLSLGVREMERSVKFYRDTLGLEMAGKPGEVTLFKAGPVLLALNGPMGRGSAGNLSGSAEIIFPVESVTFAYRAFASRGCEFRAEPHELFPGTWGATLADPDGHLLTLMGPR